jgi:hypothetical protein
MQIKAYLPNARFFVGVIIVLVVLTLTLALMGNNPYVQKARGYLGLIPGSNLPNLM